MLMPCYYCGEPSLSGYHRACQEEEQRVLAHWAARDEEPVCDLCGECRHVCDAFDQRLSDEAALRVDDLYRSEQDAS